MVDETVSSDAYLAEYSEEEIFDLYNRMIKLDRFGIIGLDESSLSIPGKSEKKMPVLFVKRAGIGFAGTEKRKAAAAVFRFRSVVPSLSGLSSAGRMRQDPSGYLVRMYVDLLTSVAVMMRPQWMEELKLPSARTT